MLVICRGDERVQKLDDVLVFDQFENFQFSVGPFRVLQIGERIRDLFDCHSSIANTIDRRANDALRAGANVLQVLVSHVHAEQSAGHLHIVEVVLVQKIYDHRIVAINLLG